MLLFQLQRSGIFLLAMSHNESTPRHITGTLSVSILHDFKHKHTCIGTTVCFISQLQSTAPWIPGSEQLIKSCNYANQVVVSILGGIS